MGNFEKRVAVLAGLGQQIRAFVDGGVDPENDKGALSNAVRLAEIQNGWFTQQNIEKCLKSWGELLEAGKLLQWLEPYDLSKITPKQVGVICAGNIPAVGAHDMFSVYLSGHAFVGKLSHDDQILLPWMAASIKKTDPEAQLNFVPRIKDIDAVIATGSGNSARYFEYYFGKYPNIIRKNRNSVAVLTGDESKEQLAGLADDIFAYFGLGCRSVSKLMLPKGYAVDHFYEGIFDWSNVIDHHKYNTNYTYNKSVYLMSKERLWDNNFLLLKQDSGLASPIGVLYYDMYDSPDELLDKLNGAEDQIQCIVSSNDVPFGQAQSPRWFDYADGVDTMSFLQGLA